MNFNLIRQYESWHQILSFANDTCVLFGAIYLRLQFDGQEKSFKGPRSKRCDTNN